MADHPDGQANGEVVSARTASATGKKKKKKKKNAGYAKIWVLNFKSTNSVQILELVHMYKMALS